MSYFNEAGFSLVNESLGNGKSSKSILKKLNSSKNLKIHQGKHKQKLVLVPRVNSQHHLEEPMKPISTSPTRGLKNRNVSNERPITVITSPINLQMTGKKLSKKPKDRALKTDKHKIGKKFIFDPQIPTTNKKEYEEKKVKSKERTDLRRFSIQGHKQSEYIKIGKTNTVDLRPNKGIELKQLDEEQIKLEDTKRTQRKINNDLNKTVKLEKKVKQSDEKFGKILKVPEKLITDKQKKLLIEKSSKKIQEEAREKTTAEVLEKLKKLARPKAKSKLKISKEKVPNTKNIKKKKKKAFEDSRLRIDPTPKYIKHHDFNKKIKEHRAATIIQRWFRSLDRRDMITEDDWDSDSYHSSGLKTERDEWVNLLESKYSGSNSAFVEEFKAQMLKNRVQVKNSDKYFDNTSKIEKSSGFSSCESEGNLIVEKVEMKESKSRQALNIPKLTLSMLKNEEFSDDELEEQSEIYKGNYMPDENISGFSSDDSDSLSSLQLVENKPASVVRRIPNMKSLDLGKFKNVSESDEYYDEIESDYESVNEDIASKNYSIPNNLGLIGTKDKLDQDMQKKFPSENKKDQNPFNVSKNLSKVDQFSDQIENNLKEKKSEPAKHGNIGEHLKDEKFKVTQIQQKEVKEANKIIDLKSEEKIKENIEKKNLINEGQEKDTCKIISNNLKLNQLSPQIKLENLEKNSEFSAKKNNFQQFPDIPLKSKEAFVNLTEIQNEPKHYSNKIENSKNKEADELVNVAKTDKVGKIDTSKRPDIVEKPEKVPNKLYKSPESTEKSDNSSSLIPKIPVISEKKDNDPCIITNPPQASEKIRKDSENQAKVLSASESNKIKFELPQKPEKIINPPEIKPKALINTEIQEKESIIPKPTIPEKSEKDLGIRPTISKISQKAQKEPEILINLSKNPEIKEKEFEDFLKNNLTQSKAEKNSEATHIENPQIQKKHNTNENSEKYSDYKQKFLESQNHLQEIKDRLSAPLKTTEKTEPLKAEVQNLKPLIVEEQNIKPLKDNQQNIKQEIPENSDKNICKPHTDTSKPQELLSNHSFFLSPEPAKPSKVMVSYNPEYNGLFESIETPEKSFEVTASPYDILQTSIIMPDILSQSDSETSPTTDQLKPPNAIIKPLKKSPPPSPKQSPRITDPLTVFPSEPINKSEKSDKKKSFTSKFLENNGELLSDRTRKFYEQGKQAFKSLESLQTPEPKIKEAEKSQISETKPLETQIKNLSFLVPNEKQAEIPENEVKIVISPRRFDPEPEENVKVKPGKSELFRSFNPLALDQSSSSSEDISPRIFTPKGLYYGEDPSELVEKVISSEIYSFLRIIPFKDSEREVDSSLEFIIEYLEVMAKELKNNEDEVLDAINTPAYQEPISKLTLIQDFNSILSKFPTLELILPPDLCSELKVYFQSLELPSRQIYLQMLFDCVNEALNYIRPFGVEGIPDPWSSKPRILFGEAELSNVFSRIISYMVKWASSKTGTYHCPESRNDEDRLQIIREEKMSSLLCLDVKDEEICWLKYEEEETQMRILLSNSIFESLIVEVQSIINN